MKTALISLQALMCAPVPDDPQDAVVATMFKERHAEFVATARQWTDQYAKGGSGAAPAVQVSPAVRRLMDMGFDQDAAQRALLEAKGNETLAIEKLLGAA
jgi:ubiquitin-conjugating enzyme (huntingtin interacting protein 2)